MTAFSAIRSIALQLALWEQHLNFGDSNLMQLSRNDKNVRGGFNRTKEKSLMLLRMSGRFPHEMNAEPPLCFMRPNAGLTKICDNFP